MFANQPATRRDFLCAGATAAVLGAAAMNVSSNGYGSVAYADETAWDMAADFVVVGAGTGQAGAVAAAVAGMSVILLEARPSVGGAMQHSGGAAWFPNTAFSQANGDSYELARTYLLHMQQGYTNFEVMDAFLDNTQNTIDTLAAGGVALTPPPFGVEYHSDWEGACVAGGRTTVVMPPEGFMGFGRGGNRLNDALIEACANLGVETFTNTTGKRLITKRETSDSVPEVIGIEAERADGTVLRIKANRGVLLATGGFEYDDELVANYVRVPYRYFTSYKTNDGGGLRMAQSVGADLRMMNEFWGNPVYTLQGEHYRNIDAPVCLACHSERSYPGAILVDVNGRRFCNEASDYDSFGNAFGGYNNTGQNGWTCDPCWMVFDNTCYETYHPNGHGGEEPGFPCVDIPEDQLYVVADTLEELAEKIGVSAEMLPRTVAEFNEFAREGRDPIFHRGETMAPIAPVFETLAPLDTPPYRAISVSCGGLGTIGGPRLNGNAQVVHVSGEVVKGLYAAGNCAGVGAPGPAYGGAGGTIGPAFVMGVIAAQHAAARDDVTSDDFYVVERPVRTIELELGEGEYAGLGSGLGGDVVVVVKKSGETIDSIEVVEHRETEGVGSVACDFFPGMMVEAQSADIDAMAGATVTCRAIAAAVKDALSKA